MDIKKYDGIISILNKLDENPSGRGLLLPRAKTHCSKCGSELVATKIEDSGYAEYATTFIFTCSNKRFWNAHSDKEYLYLPFQNYDKILAEWAC